MKSKFKFNLIQHIFDKRNGEKGFTLIELLVVIIIIGILAAIALPSFLNQAAKARQSEAKTYVGSGNRSQQAYYLEKARFATDLSTLTLGIPATTANYSYATYASYTSVTGTATFAYTTGTAQVKELKSYAGAVNIAPPAGTIEASTLATLAESNKALVNGGSTPTASVTGVTDVFSLTNTAAPSPITGSATASTGWSTIQ